jgi:hypothetical protein
MATPSLDELTAAQLDAYWTLGETLFNAGVLTLGQAATQMEEAFELGEADYL